MGIKVLIDDFEARGESLTNYDEIINDENIIILTKFTIKDCIKITEDVEGKNEYLSKNINGIEITGKYNIANANQETEDIGELFEWYKKTAHEKESYRKITVEFSDVSGNIYDGFVFEKAFIVEFKEEYSHKMGSIEYYAFLRKFEDAEPAIEV